MYIALEIVFWVLVFFFFQTWIFYPVLMYMYLLISGGKGKKYSDRVPGNLPKVSVILPVHNAEARIVDKINNLFALDYPSENLEVIVISDGSTDATESRARAAFGDGIVMVSVKENEGKSAAQNRGFALASNPVLLLTDVDSSFDPGMLRIMVGRLDDPTVGCVGANVQQYDAGWEASGSHLIYWRIEQVIRTSESRLGVLISISGAAFIVRRNLVRQLDHDTGDDFIIPLDVFQRGYRTVFAEEALAHDYWSSQSMMAELKVRRRIASRNLLGLLRRKSVLNPFRHPALASALVSHELLRWLVPVLMAGMLALNVVLATFSHFYLLLIALQAAGYILAALGIVASFLGRRVILASQLGAFVWANLGLLWGIISFTSGRRIYAYESRSACQGQHADEGR